jgi:putative ABC transport system ATP-binding protein
MTVVVITHEHAISPMADRVIHLKSGRIENVSLNAHPVPVENIEW